MHRRVAMATMLWNVVGLYTMYRYRPDIHYTTQIPPSDHLIGNILQKLIPILYQVIFNYTSIAARCRELWVKEWNGSQTKSD